MLERSTCLCRRFGAIIVKNDSIVSTGYNGAPRGRKNCTDIGHCVCNRAGGGESSEACRAVHAEMNCIISVDAATGQIIEDANSCRTCRRMIINAGISRVVIRTSPTCFVSYNVRDWVLNDDSIGYLS